LDLSELRRAASGLEYNGTSINSLFAQRRNALRPSYRDLMNDVDSGWSRASAPLFRQCSSLLHPSGAMLLQAITIRDQFYDQARRSVDFIKRFIFPGSFIPSVQTLVNSVARATDFKLSHLEDFGPHYALTLKAWRERFLARRAEVRALGYPERFVRMWEFYLCYCEGGFEERQLGVVQMLLTRPRSRRAAIATVHAPTSRP
jgi:cyclopropane-fatty-acyl-phospholipid synthase